MRKRKIPVTFEDHIWRIILDMLDNKIMPIEAIQKIVSLHEEIIEKVRI